MPLSPPPPSRAHLRLASVPAARPRGQARLVHRLRALAAAVALAFATLAAWWSQAVALAPLVWRRFPAGRRLRPHAPREARVIPFQRRTAVTR